MYENEEKLYTRHQMLHRYQDELIALSLNNGRGYRGQGRSLTLSESGRKISVNAKKESKGEPQKQRMASQGRRGHR